MVTIVCKSGTYTVTDLVTSVTTVYTNLFALLVAIRGKQIKAFLYAK